MKIVNFTCRPDLRSSGLEEKMFFSPLKEMKYKLTLFLTALCIHGGFLVGAESHAAAKPNIIVILVDDMGFSDIGCYGSEIPTPNLDALATDGLRYRQFYNTARCCPSRAALLTGLYSHQTGVGNMMDNEGQLGYQGRLNNSCVTIAEALKPAGYFTAMCGKWHVGQEHGVTPWGRGFDRSLNAPAGGFYFADGQPAKSKLYLNGKFIPNDDPQLPPNWYSTDLWTTFGLKFIDESLVEKKPFFLYLAHNAPHFPMQAPADEIAKFRGKYKAGWDKLRVARHEKQVQLGVIDSAWPISPRSDQVSAWDKLTPKEQDRFDHIMAVYAACVAHMDKAVGDLVNGLKQRGILDNTVIFFMSDNGGNAESGPKGRDVGDPSTGPSNWFCGESWANLENTPLRRFKHFTMEGGISTPLIVHWPSGIPAKGEWRNQAGHLIDIMPTCVELGGATYPKEFKAKPILPMEGKSLVGTFTDQPLTREAIYWEHIGNAAVRVGDMKLVRTGRTSAWELYDLSKDRTELHDLATAQPATVKELSAKWEAWAVRAHVVPYPENAKGHAKKERRPKRG
jgi:arylsulfatase A-like enzyme